MGAIDHDLSSKAVEGPALPLEGVDDVHGSDGLPLSVLCVGDSVADNVLQEDLEDPPGFFVDEARNPLDPSPPCQAANGWLRDALETSG